MAQKTEGLVYRLNAGICLVNNQGLIFTALRRGWDKYSDAWQMPQGGIDAGEEPLAAAKRELFEETAIPAEDIQLLETFPEWLPYDFPPEIQNNLKSLGQKQKWFCFRYTGNGNIDLSKAQDHEFDLWEWRTADEVLDRVVEFKRPTYQKVLARFQAHFVMG